MRRCSNVMNLDSVLGVVIAFALAIAMAAVIRQKCRFWYLVSPDFQHRVPRTCAQADAVVANSQAADTVLVAHK